MSPSKPSSIVIALLALCSLAHGQIEAPEIPLGPKPEPLLINPPKHAPRGLIRWYGNPKSTPARNVDEMNWSMDGRRMFTKPAGSAFFQLWKPSPSGTSVELEGAINMWETMFLSPDGRWLFGVCKIEGKFMPALQMHRADTLEGVWSLDFPYHAMRKAAFSRDGKWLALVHEGSRPQGAERKIFISILDASTGKRVQVLQPRTGWDEFDGFNHPRLSVFFTNDALLLHPSYDEQRRVKRYPIATWKMEFASDELHSEPSEKMLMSNDGRWMLLWGDHSYAALELSGGIYVKRFEGNAWTEADENEQFNSIRLSPDSSALVLSGSGKHKVIRLADRKVLHDGTDTCLCGEFSPDGRIFWNSCAPFRSVDTRTWQRLPEESPQHRQEVTDLAFSPNGKMLAAASCDSLRIWSAEKDAPPLNLVAPQNPARFAALSWSPDGREIWAGDGQDFSKWRMSDANLKSREIKGEVFFKSPPWPREGLRYQRIDFMPKTGACLLAQSDVRTRLVETRLPSSPSVVKRLPTDPYPMGLILFRPDESEYFHIAHDESSSIICARRLSDGSIRKTTLPTYGMLVGMTSSGSDLIVIFNQKICFIDTETLQIREKCIYPPAGTAFQGGDEVATMSPNGQWLYTTASVFRTATNPAPTKSVPLLVNIARDGEAILLEPHDSEVSSVAFSADSTRLAIGHRGGLISLWDVATLASSSPALAAGQEKLNPQSQKTTARQSKPFSWSSQWPARNRILDDGDERVITDKGAVLCGDASVDVGQLLVNGAEPTVVAGRSGVHEFPKPPAETYATTYLIKAEVEQSALDGKVRIQRQLRGSSRGDMKWFDTFENISGEPQTVILSYRHKFGGTSGDLLVQNHRPALLQDGQLASEKPILSTGLITSINGIRRHVGICFSSKGAPQPPVVRWIEADKAVATEWTIRLEPYEKRAVMHDMLQRKLKEGEQPSVGAQVFMWSFMGDLLLLPRLPLLVNFAPFVQEEANRKDFSLGMYYNQSALPREAQEMKSMRVDEKGFKKDSMGFRWRITESAASGMGAEFGAQRILALWVDGHPVTFSDAVPMPSSASAPSGEAPKFRTEFTSIKGTTKVLRSLQWSETDSIFATHDEVFNPGTEPVKCQVQLMVAAETYFRHVEDVEGNVLDIASPQPASAFGGKLVIVSPGESKPSILLSIGDNEARRQAKVHVVANRGLFITYDLNLGPGERVPLTHLAAQRPLSVYAKAQEAFDEIAAPTPSERAATASLPFPENWRKNP